MRRLSKSIVPIDHIKQDYIKDSTNFYYYLSISIGLINILFFSRAYSDNVQNTNKSFMFDVQQNVNNVQIALLLSFGSTFTLFTDIIGETCYYLSSRYFQVSEGSKATMYSHFKIDILERFIIVLYTLVSNTFFYISISSQYVERSFVFCNNVQNLGYITVIHALCVKLDPTYFAKMIYSSFIIAINFISMSSRSYWIYSRL